MKVTLLIFILALFIMAAILLHQFSVERRGTMTPEERDEEDHEKQLW